MSDEVLGTTYPDSHKTIEVGDWVTIDGHAGKVVQIVAANSKDSIDLDCEDTGGLMLDMKSSGLTLIPFGNSCVVRETKDAAY